MIEVKVWFPFSGVKIFRESVRAIAAFRQEGAHSAGNPGDGRSRVDFGHVGAECGGRYLSYWRPKQRGEKYSTHSSYQADCAGMGRKADETVKLRGLCADAVDERWGQALKKAYHLADHNCCTALGRSLLAGFRARHTSLFSKLQTVARDPLGMMAHGFNVLTCDLSFWEPLSVFLLARWMDKVLDA